MANITKVDYEAIPRQAMSMRNHGKELNKELTEAYRTIDEMHNSWFGKRYNELVTEFNKIIPSINELLDLVVGEIPFALETVANNYAMADRGSGVTKAAKEAPSKIVDLSIRNDVGMKFVTEGVTTCQSKVTKNFQNAKEKMNVIESEYARITWQSEAAEAFKARFQKLKGEILNSLDELNSSFTNLMNQTKEDIQRTENANTVQ